MVTINFVRTIIRSDSSASYTSGDELMQQPASPEEQRTQEQHPQAEADYGEEFSAREALDERYLHYAPPSGGFLWGAYERFLQMPVPVVLVVLWLAGMALLSSCVLMLYMLVASLASVL
jgi:hypothetical protein